MCTHRYIFSLNNTRKSQVYTFNKVESDHLPARLLILSCLYMYFHSLCKTGCFLFSSLSPPFVAPHWPVDWGRAARSQRRKEITKRVSAIFTPFSSIFSFFLLSPQLSHARALYYVSVYDFPASLVALITSPVNFCRSTQCSRARSPATSEAEGHWSDSFRDRHICFRYCLL